MSLLEIKDASFDAFSGIDMLYSVKPSSNRKGGQLIAISIDGRTIPINLFQDTAIPPDYSAVFLFSSEIFHASADSSRQKLNFQDTVDKPKLIALLRREVGKILEDNTPGIVKRNNQTKEKLEDVFPHLLGYFEYSTVGLIDKDESLNTAQQKFFKAQKEVLQSSDLDDATYEKSLELSSRTLTEYILFQMSIKIMHGCLMTSLG